MLVKDGNSYRKVYTRANGSKYFMKNGKRHNVSDKDIVDVKSRKECPNGKERLPSGRCVKKCVPPKTRNPVTNRCIKPRMARRAPPRRSPSPARRSPSPARESNRKMNVRAMIDMFEARRAPSPPRKSSSPPRKSPSPPRRAPSPPRKSPSPPRKPPSPPRRAPSPPRKPPSPPRRAPSPEELQIKLLEDELHKLKTDPIDEDLGEDFGYSYGELVDYRNEKIRKLEAKISRLKSAM